MGVKSIFLAVTFSTKFPQKWEVSGVKPSKFVYPLIIFPNFLLDRHPETLFVLAPQLSTPNIAYCLFPNSHFLLPISHSLPIYPMSRSDPIPFHILYLISLNLSGFLKPLLSKISLSFKKQLRLCKMVCLILPFNQFCEHNNPLKT